MKVYGVVCPATAGIETRWLPGRNAVPAVVLR
jgi:hypothetical protein